MDEDRDRLLRSAAFAHLDKVVTTHGDVLPEARRSYVTRLAVQRLHQAKFRQRVIAAYRTTCAICRLRHGELLDARDLRAVLALGVQGLRGAHDASLPPSASGGGGSRTRVSRVFGGASPSAAGE